METRAEENKESGFLVGPKVSLVDVNLLVLFDFITSFLPDTTLAAIPALLKVSRLIVYGLHTCQAREGVWGWMLIEILRKTQVPDCETRERKKVKRVG